MAIVQAHRATPRVDFMFENVRSDLIRSCRANQGHHVSAGGLFRELWNPGTQAVLVHRFGHWSDQVRIPIVRVSLRILHFLLQYLFAWRIGIFIPVKARIGPGFVIHTWGGGIFLPNAPIGRDVTIIGGGVQFDYDTRGIGDEVTIAPGTKAIGKITIGNRVRTAPNSVVQVNVPDDCVVFGNPGRVIGPMPKGFSRPAPARVEEASQPTVSAPTA